MKTKRIKLVNAQQMAKEHPDTFEAPSPFDLGRLGVGDIVKVCNRYESFWVQIVERREGDIFLGRVDNFLLNGRIGYGDHIQLHACNVYSVYDGPTA